MFFFGIFATNLLLGLILMRVWNIFYITGRCFCLPLTELFWRPVERVRFCYRSWQCRWHYGRQISSKLHENSVLYSHFYVIFFILMILWSVFMDMCACVLCVSTNYIFLYFYVCHMCVSFIIFIPTDIVCMGKLKRLFGKRIVIITASQD